MAPIHRPDTAKGRLTLHVLTYNGARLLLVCVAAGVILAVDALTTIDVPVVLVPIVALGASLPLSALTLRKLRRTINADIEAVDRERAATQRVRRRGKTPPRDTVK